MNMSVTVAEQFAIHLVSAERFRYRLLNERHFPKIHDFEITLKMMKLRFMFFAEEQRIAVKMLMISYYNISCFKLTHEERIISFLYQVDSVAYYTHIYPPQIIPISCLYFTLIPLTLSSSGVTYAVQFVVYITNPGFEPAGFFTFATFV